MNAFPPADGQMKMKRNSFQLPNRQTWQQAGHFFRESPPERQNFDKKGRGCYRTPNFPRDVFARCVQTQMRGHRDPQPLPKCGRIYPSSFAHIEITHLSRTVCDESVSGALEVDNLQGSATLSRPAIRGRTEIVKNLCDAAQQHPPVSLRLKFENLPNPLRIRAFVPTLSAMLRLACEMVMNQKNSPSRTEHTRRAELNRMHALAGPLGASPLLPLSLD